MPIILRMRKHLLIIISFSVLFLWYQASAYDIINFDDYKTQVTATIQAGKSISRTKLIEELKTIQGQPCITERESDLAKDGAGLYYLLSPICLLRADFSTIDPQDIINEIRLSVKWFSITYNEVSPNFSYEGTQPFFEKKEVKTVIPKSIQDKAILAFFQKNNTMIRMPLSYLAFDAIKNYTFYTTKKDLTPLKRCTKQNYTVALNSFDGVNLKPWASLNLNTHLAYRRWYCKGIWSQNLKFYWWVCWFATQLFRTSLIIPDIKIVKRYPHSIWLVPYYSDYVFGDDAAIYEMSKQFEIKNNSNQTSYFKILKQDNAAYLVSIVPSKPTKWVKISKYETDTLKATIVRETYDITNNSILNIQLFYASYTNKAYTVQ